MNKFIYTFVFLLLLSTTSIAQQDRYALKIGLHTGFSNYYGDLSHQVSDLPHQFQQPIQDLNFLSYGLSVEYHVSKIFGLRLLGMKSQFKASDRSYENSTNYNRALNVQTDLLDASLLGVVYFDNDLVLNSRSTLAPYFLFGGGLTHFENKGDLLSSDNNRYYYWSDNSIRTEAENGSNTATAPIIEQDYKYETTLSSLNTEGSNYTPITWNVALGLGLKFRLSSRFYLHLEALVRYTGSDYLDDISANYRSNYTDNFQAYVANPSNVNRSTRGTSPEMNDWYTFIGLSAHYSFGQKTYKIQPSIIYTENLLLSSNKTIVPVNTNENKETVLTKPTNTTDADTIIQKVLTTTTTIKTVTVDTIDNRSSSVEPKTIHTIPLKIPRVVSNERMVLNTNDIGRASISQINPPTASGTNNLDTPRLPIDSLSQNRLGQKNTGLISGDSTTNFVDIPSSNASSHSIRLPIDTILENRGSKPIANKILKDSVQKVIPTKIEPKNTVVQNKVNKSTNTIDLDKTHVLELQQQEQKYHHELLLQQEKYEHQLAALKWQKDLEKEKDAPSTKEQDLLYQLKLTEQKYTDELEKQKLLNQLQQQKHESQLKIQELQNQLKLEQLKKVNEGTGSINTPAPSDDSIYQKLDHLTQPLDQTTHSDRDTIIINNNKSLPSTPTSNVEAELVRVQANQQALLSEINALKHLTNAINEQQDTFVINNNNTYTSPIQSTNTKEELIQAQSTQRALLLKIKDLEVAQSTAMDTIKIIQIDSIFLDNGNHSELTKRLNQQQNSNNSLTAKLATAHQKNIEQQRKIEQLQNQIKKKVLKNESSSKELEVFLAEKKGTYITKTYFDVGKSSLTIQAKETLTTLVHYLERYPNVQFWVKGFASKTGSKDVNERLSAERANQVAKFLKQSGIQETRIRTTPLGELDGSSLNNELDRRAEVHLSF